MKSPFMHEGRLEELRALLSSTQFGWRPVRVVLMSLLVVAIFSVTCRFIHAGRLSSSAGHQQPTDDPDTSLYSHSLIKVVIAFVWSRIAHADL